MESKNTIMQAIFSELSERNKDIMILVAKSVKVAQETDNHSCNSSKNPSKQIAYWKKQWRNSDRKGSYFHFGNFGTKGYWGTKK